MQEVLLPRMHLIPAGDAHRDLPADEEAAHEKHPPPPRRQPPPRHQPPETSLFSEQRLDREERDVHVHLIGKQARTWILGQKSSNAPRRRRPSAVPWPIIVTAPPFCALPAFAVMPKSLSAKFERLHDESANSFGSKIERQRNA